MDAAEAWLAEHDPDYESSRLSWRNLKGGEYVIPWREEPRGDVNDLERLVTRGGGSWVESVHLPERECALCGRTFMPRQRDHAYCSERHRRRAYQRRYRDRRAQRVTLYDVGAIDGPFADSRGVGS